MTTEQSDEIKQVKSFRPQTIDVTNQIVKMVEPLLQTKFSDYQYLASADHIDFAVTRISDHIDIDPAIMTRKLRICFQRNMQFLKK